MLNERADKAIYRIVHFMGYGQYLEEHGADTSRIDILQTLGEQTATPEGLLERLTQLRDIVQSPRKQENALFTLSTIHSSKGLEYGRVFLMDVVDGIFPKLDDKDKIPEEERRLFYVGMTRAKEELAVFTFQKSDMVSTFGQELFPTKKPLEKACQPIPKPGVKKALSEEMLGMLVGCCVPGQWVEHTKFGSGIIVGATDDIVSIRFTSGQIRRFMLREALRMGALKVIRK